MAERLNLSGFTPSGGAQRALGAHIDLCVDILGGDLWLPTPYPSEEEEYQEAELQLRKLQNMIRYQLNLSPSGNNTIALIDWTALDRATTLLEGGGKEVEDPFVAFANLSAVLSAILFFDRTMVIDDGRAAAARANRVFRLGDVFKSIEAHGGSAIHQMLLAHYSWAWHTLDGASKRDTHWIAWLQEGWEELLPAVSFPAHTGRQYERLSYNISRDREPTIDRLFDGPQATLGTSFLSARSG